MLFQGASGYSIGYANDDVWGYGGKTNKSYLIAKYVDRWHPANITDDPYNPATQWVVVIIRHYATISPILRIMVVDGIMVFPFGFRKLLYLRLKSMEIGYNLPKSFMKESG